MKIEFDKQNGLTFLTIDRSDLESEILSTFVAGANVFKLCIAIM